MIFYAHADRKSGTAAVNHNATPRVENFFNIIPGYYLCADLLLLRRPALPHKLE